MFTTIKEDVTVAFSHVTITGDVRHNPTLHAMTLDEPNEPVEVITVNLSAYGMKPQHGNVFIKDWSEHDGLTASLVEAGVVEIVREITVGPFESRAYEVRVIAVPCESDLLRNGPTPASETQTQKVA